MFGALQEALEVLRSSPAEVKLTVCRPPEPVVPPPDTVAPPPPPRDPPSTSSLNHDNYGVCSFNSKNRKHAYFDSIKMFEFLLFLC